MSSLLVDERDQKFVLHEMLRVEDLGQTSLFEHISGDVMDLSLDAAAKLALRESLPTMATADREGCRLENGSVFVPECFHRLKEHYDRGKWASTHLLRENGGQGFPMALWTALYEGFMHNAAFFWSMPKPICATSFIELFGSQEQKAKYLENMVSGKWGPATAANDDASGCDVTLQRTVAVRQSDGSYRIKGTKGPVTGGDSDLFENIIHVVLARIEGDPKDETGLSWFLVPKYRVNGDGSMGPRNDYAVVGIERKLGLNGNPSCTINFGENDSCHAELLGEARQAMRMSREVILRRGYLCCGTFATGVASAAYLHALDYAKNRIQGTRITAARDRDAPHVAIVEHPDVRRMLLWMKAHVEGMRALLYYSGLCMDHARAEAEPTEQERWSGLMDLLLPICRIYTGEIGFRVTETAIQVHGRYGYFSDYPVQQFLRDVKLISLWETSAGVHARSYVTRATGKRGGRDFANLLREMGRTVEEYSNIEGMQDLSEDVQGRINLLGEVGTYLSNCPIEGKFLVPVSNATPFARLTGDVCLGWLLFWQAGIAARRLGEIYEKDHIDPKDNETRSDFLGRNKEAAFYAGKVHSARYFIKNVLPQVDGVAEAIRNEDLSVMAVHNDSF